MTSTDNWQSTQYQANAVFVPQLGEPLLELLAPQAHETILDLGCGDGMLTQMLTDTCRKVVGIDSSPNMIESAKQKGLNAHVGDAHHLTVEQEFDAIISNAALHWMLQPEKVLRGVYDALKVGGRFVAEMGGKGNVQNITNALNAQRNAIGLKAAEPWFFPSIDEYQKLLNTAGFEVKQITLFERPTPLPDHISGWLNTFGHAFFEDMSEQQKQSAIASASQQLAESQLDENGIWYADYMRLRFIAIKPK